MRTLVVTRWAPWPPTSGARHRSANVIAALADLGEVDVFLLVDPRLEDELTPPPGLQLGKVGRAPRATPGAGRLERLRSMVPGARPAAIRLQEDGAARAAFAAWGPRSYDLAWFVRIESWLALAPLVDAPAVIDYDDLRDQLVRSRLRSAWQDPPGSIDMSTLARRARRRLVGDADARAWARLQRRTSRDVQTVVVCSEIDRQRLGVANAAIVPNGADLPAEPVGRATVGSPPTLCLHGSLNYGPNADAAAVLVRDVAPRVRALVPDVTVRLVGRTDQRVARLAGTPGVVVTGPVPDITTELAQADVVVVPLRQGAGTRIKILEALAHRVPVVATSIAVEGLDAVHGEHLLVADDPERFAEACVDLLRGVELRARLADAGERLARERYGWEHARAAVTRLATEVVGNTGRP